MSMLAERKRKQKWSLNPRGKEWSQDANKFGQKMLEKMGWQHGKGLGANETGITEHIKISYKNDSKGMGYKESNDQWTEHETNFSALLGSLTGEVADLDLVNVNSLEKKSQSSRARVHYHKFTRGKDLSRYSEKDIANIFGKKSLKEVKPVTPIEVKQEETSQKENESGFLRNAGSMTDYFKKKLPGFGKSNGYMLGNNGVLKKAEDSESESELRPSFGFGFKSENTSQEQDKTTFVSYIKEEQSTKRKAQETNEDVVFLPMKKSKKDKKQKASEENLGLSNPSFNPLGTPMQIQKHILEPINESLSEETVEDVPEETPKKIKKKKLKESISEQSIEDKSVETPKKNKRKKNSSGEESAEENAIETPKKKKKSNNCLPGEEAVEEENICASPKKKKKTVGATGILNPVFEEIREDTGGCFEEADNPYEVKVKKKKKKKKDLELDEETDTKKSQSHFDNPNFKDSEESPEQIEAIENPYEVKRKNKKKKHKKSAVDVESPASGNVEENLQDSNPSEENPHEIKVKRKKKKKSRTDSDDAEENSVDRPEKSDGEGKKKKKNTSLAIDNPGFEKRSNDAEETSTDSSRLEENPYEIRKKKKSKKKQPLADSTEVNTIVDAANPFEIKTKKKKKSKKQSDSIEADSQHDGDAAKGIENPALRLNDSADTSLMIEDGDLMMNVVSTPVTKEERPPAVPGSLKSTDSARRRKSVRFSDVTQERIIPSKEEMRELYREAEEPPRGKPVRGVDNVTFDRQQVSLEENMDSMSKALDGFQAEIDNDINEEKMKALTLEELMVGEVGNPRGENERVPGGSKLKFKHANLNSRTPLYHLNQNGPKKSYKHLIKGDILVMFDGTNLHELEGYGAKRKSEEV